MFATLANFFAIWQLASIFVGIVSPCYWDSKVNTFSYPSRYLILGVWDEILNFLILGV
jgi:hypothetical protein